MAYRILRPFVYSHDGFSTRQATPGEDLDDLPAASIAGLIAEGYILKSTAPPENKMAEPLETPSLRPIANKRRSRSR